MIAAVLAGGCASQNHVNDGESPSFTQLRAEELERERREFVRERREQLDQLDTRISRLEARLDHEAKFVDAHEKAEWSQQLFDLREQHRKAGAELERAEKASPDEWAAMRGDVGYAIDSLQAGVTKAGTEINRLFNSGDSDTNAAPVVDLCRVRVDGTTAVLIEQGDHIVVQMVTGATDELGELRHRAKLLAQRGTDSQEGASEGRNEQMPTPAGSQRDLIKEVSVRDVENGVHVEFAAEPGRRSALRRELEREVERIRDRSC
jgi:BMFP domain-containing protein YqiC